MAKFIPKVVPEPTWEKRTEPCSQFDLVFAFQWYNHNKESKDARKYLVEYLTKNSQITELWDVTHAVDDNPYVLKS